MVTIDCSSCGHKNDFEQPSPFHAGFGNQGFLYNDAGNLTLACSSAAVTHQVRGPADPHKKPIRPADAELV